MALLNANFERGPVRCPSPRSRDSRSIRRIAKTITQKLNVSKSSQFKFCDVKRASKRDAARIKKSDNRLITLMARGFNIIEHVWKPNNADGSIPLFKKGERAFVSDTYKLLTTMDEVKKAVAEYVDINKRNGNPKQ